MQMIYRLKGNDENFPKRNFYWNGVTDGHLSEILSYFGRFYHDLSIIILKSRDIGCQFWKVFSFTWFHIRF